MACGEDVFKRTDNWGEQIQCLRDLISDLKKEIDAADNRAQSFSSTLGITGNIMKDMMKSVNNLKNDMKAFTTSAERQYALAEEIAQRYKESGACCLVGIQPGGARAMVGPQIHHAEICHRPSDHQLCLCRFHR